jgi:hypothetical protein
MCLPCGSISAVGCVGFLAQQPQRGLVHQSAPPTPSSPLSSCTPLHSPLLALRRTGGACGAHEAQCMRTPPPPIPHRHPPFSFVHARAVYNLQALCVDSNAVTLTVTDHSVTRLVLPSVGRRAARGHLPRCARDRLSAPSALLAGRASHTPPCSRACLLAGCCSNTRPTWTVR